STAHPASCGPKSVRRRPCSRPGGSALRSRVPIQLQLPTPIHARCSTTPPMAGFRSLEDEEPFFVASVAEGRAYLVRGVLLAGAARRSSDQVWGAVPRESWCHAGSSSISSRVTRG